MATSSWRCLDVRPVRRTANAREGAANSERRHGTARTLARGSPKCRSGTLARECWAEPARVHTDCATSTGGRVAIRVLTRTPTSITRPHRPSRAALRVTAWGRPDAGLSEGGGARRVPRARTHARARYLSDGRPPQPTKPAAHLVTNVSPAFPRPSSYSVVALHVYDRRSSRCSASHGFRHRHASHLLECPRDVEHPPGNSRDHSRNGRRSLPDRRFSLGPDAPGSESATSAATTRTSADSSPHLRRPPRPISPAVTPHPRHHSERRPRHDHE